MSYVGNIPVLQLFKKTDFTGDGSTTSFDLVDPVTSVNGILVVAGGVPQEPTTAYTIETSPFATTLEFSVAPANGVDIYVVWLGSPGSDDIDLSTYVRVTDNRLNEIHTLVVSDETTALTATTDVFTFRMPYAFTLTEVRASVNTAPTGATLIVDINETGTTVLSTKLSIDVGETTSTTAASPAVISDASIADDAEISIDVDQIGSGTAGAGLKVYLIGYATA